MGKVKIYSNRHSGWWLPNFDGYTSDDNEAGIYDMETLNNLYPDITFNESNENYLVAVDPKTVIIECIDLLGRSGINSKELVRHKLHNILPYVKEE